MPDELRMEGFLLRLPAAAARSADAWETPTNGAEACGVALAALLTLVEGVMMLRPEAFDEERCRRDGVGWVGPVSWWVGIVSLGSMGRREGVLEAELFCEALLATDAECWARKADSSRVKRLTCAVC